jgi:glycosyltransferase involved in cell wall biosynthesis
MAVESVLCQTLADFELLVVDDGSTDGTMEALAEVSDPRLRCLANPQNMGPGAARNTGIRAARAEWVAFQDSDDEWLPRKLERQMALLADTGPEVIACYTGMAIVGQHRNGRTSLGYIPGPGVAKAGGNLRDALMAHSFISTQMLMVRRSALLEIGGFDEALPALEDWDCAIRLSSLGTFAFVDEPLVMQYFSDNSITHSSVRRLQARRRILEKNFEELAGSPHVLADHHIAISGEEWRLGDIAAARASLAKAGRLRPFSAAIWLRALRLLALAATSGRGRL